jgi:transglutaminase-like putative cysteine protease
VKRFAALLAVVTTVVLLLAQLASAKTLMMEGRLDSSIAMRQQMEFNVDNGSVQTFTFRFALPADYQTKSVSQSIDSLLTRMEPEPSSSVVEKDRFGNRFQKAVWNNVNQNIRINLGYTANVRSELSAMDSRTPFPIGKVPSGEALYLKSTEMVQSDSSEIAELAKTLTASSRNEYEAVTAITNHVADSIKYTFNPPKYDALYTLKTKSGNCQNFAHLSIALLRSVGIPARIVGGITLKDPWKVPIDSRNSIVQSMGQGGHAWMEIYFPDLGWLSYDPQQSRQFTSSRHIKQTHGLDSRDINDTWRGAPYLPRYSELIEGTFRNDDIKLKVKNTGKDPRPYIISNMVALKPLTATAAEPPKIADPATSKPVSEPSPEKPAVKPAQPDVPVDIAMPPDDDSDIKIKKPKKVTKPKIHTVPKPKVKTPEPKVEIVKVVPPEPQRKKPVTGSLITLGNMDFPNLVNAYSVQGDTGTRILDKETSEYVTSQHIFAQSFTIKDGLALNKVSLAMRKFGGDGSVYVDLVRDDGSGRPDIRNGIRSDLVSLEKISRKPGYYWVDFTFHQDSQSRLKQGKYWIVLRYSGEAIMNWFYIPGKPYSESDDTRSTAKGFQWEDILNYDFVFKVTGKAI